ncbi:MAG: helix-hairpin-helix domain-containing protein [Eubacteriales bacterium]
MENIGRKIWWGVLGVLIVAAVFRYLLPVSSPEQLTENEDYREIVVYITGAVNNPGLIHLPLDARLDDALQVAELSNDADLFVLNPAQKLKDGQKIIVPYKTDQLVDEGVVLESSGEEPVKNVSATVSVGNADGKVNINTADLEQLDAIPGIGPALAQRIIDYRAENGLFSSPEEIQNVSGIGAKTYDKMASSITVGP